MLPFEEVEKKFELEWTSAGFEDEYQEQEYKKDGLAQLRAFHGTTLAAPPEVVAQEKAFELPMENDVVLKGRMDQVNRIAPGEEEIVDYKTGKPKDEDKAKKDLQLSVYALAAREVFDWNPARLTFYNLQTNQAVSAVRDHKKLNKVRAERSSRRHPRGKVPSQARLLVQILRLRIYLPGARAGLGGQRLRRGVTRNCHSHAASIRAAHPRNQISGETHRRRKKSGAPRPCREAPLETFTPRGSLAVLRFPCVPIRAIAPRTTLPSEQRVTPRFTR